MAKSIQSLPCASGFEVLPKFSLNSLENIERSLGCAVLGLVLFHLSEVQVSRTVVHARISYSVVLIEFLEGGWVRMCIAEGK